jgi:hypothetical protein
MGSRVASAPSRSCSTKEQCVNGPSQYRSCTNSTLRWAEAKTELKEYGCINRTDGNAVKVQGVEESLVVVRCKGKLIVHSKAACQSLGQQ